MLLKSKIPPSRTAALPSWTCSVPPPWPCAPSTCSTSGSPSPCATTASASPPPPCPATPTPTSCCPSSSRSPATSSASSSWTAGAGGPSSASARPRRVKTALAQPVLFVSYDTLYFFRCGVHPGRSLVRQQGPGRPPGHPLAHREVRGVGVLRHRIRLHRYTFTKPLSYFLKECAGKKTWLRFDTFSQTH